MKHTYKNTAKNVGWALWFITPDQNFLYTKAFPTRKEAREYWAWKTAKNPKYKVVKVQEVITTAVKMI
jgi:hypothetical protein